MIGLCEQIEGVNSAVRGVAGAVHERIDILPVGAPDRLNIAARLSTDRHSTLAMRIAKLEKYVLLVVSSVKL